MDKVITVILLATLDDQINVLLMLGGSRDTDYKGITEMPNNCFFGEIAKFCEEQRSLFQSPPQSREFMRAHLSDSTKAPRRVGEGEESQTALGPF